MKMLCLYYSMEGNCRKWAEPLKAKTNWDVAEILLENGRIQPKGIWKYFAGGKEALLKQTPAINPLPVDPGTYDLVFVGTPVWYGTMAPAIRTFLSTTNWRGGKVALFALHRGRPGKTLSQMRELVEAHQGTVIGNHLSTDLHGKDSPKTLDVAGE